MQSESVTTIVEKFKNLTVEEKVQLAKILGKNVQFTDLIARYSHIHRIFRIWQRTSEMLFKQIKYYGPITSELEKVKKSLEAYVSKFKGGKPRRKKLMLIQAIKDLLKKRPELAHKPYDIWQNLKDREIWENMLSYNCVRKALVEVRKQPIS